ncbi:MAG: endo-1,4-beta-xylanase, partial [Planctomycetaceae bacterium]|nr:endo-1,4-beta-xylanase [Planctomycetaceae bacterium]
RAAVLRTESPETSVGLALVAIDLANRATEMLCRHYTEQRLSFRRSRTPRLPVFLGCRLSQIPADEAAYCSAFNAVLMDTTWRSLEPRDGEYEWTPLDGLITWAQQRGLAILGGPLIDLSHNRMPDWLKSWSGDLLNLQSFAADFVETVVGQFVGRVRHWEVVTGANRGGVSELDEEQRINLVVRAISAARQVDEHIQISLRVVQPWGEYLSETENHLSPIQFVDTLRRCGVGIGEINLELQVSTEPSRNLWRDSLSLSQLLDQWAILQLPINVMLRVPESLPPCPRHRSNDPDVDQCRRLEDIQVAWLQNTVMMCLSKERVVGVYYLDWQDGMPAGAPTGLKRPDGTNRPVLDMLTAMQQTFWDGRHN